MVNTATIWRSTLERLLQHESLDPVTRQWLQEAHLLASQTTEGGAHEETESLYFSLQVHNDLARDVLTSHWLEVMEEALQEVTGRTIVLEVTHEPGEESLPAQEEVATPHLAASTSAAQNGYNFYDRSINRSIPHKAARTPEAPSYEQNAASYQSFQAGVASQQEQWENEQRSGILTNNRLNPRYSFDTFIVGSSNRLAHAASLAVAEAPGESYNPLFLYGGVGLGKTHLLHAIGQQGVQTGLAVLYVSSEQFTNEIINAIRYRTTEEFRAKYRSVDILLVDDIQFIAGKESTEEEFFHTFNSLHEMSKQIVICSDRPPKAIASLEERLRSRFEWGLVADIQPPDLETRMAILRVKADALHYRVPDEIISYIAGRVQTNIRELEGCLNRLMAYQQLHRVDLTLDVARAAMSSLGADHRETHLDGRQIAQAVADYYRVSFEAMCSKQRDKHIVVPRQVAMYLIRQETQISLFEIGQLFGKRDHSTVLHACEKIERNLKQNPTLRQDVSTIREQLLRD
ncbi:hypothetical protein KSC_076190 [Ktedonobacter sp. SOSP1-52]|uniref:chromosomal replication initiator protein DnaA n=1 Tax=Ktedonobacter sp. SOSP1-52 TaxID=2778366 RepID=UPI0019167971|nr:chromosomal replication initiator protein DnaA [Ktedonobacter sp. SOSP1-52]GHO68727.1 hypothetical protein KSC_076190 [Ktedonobacter sp. SOSP1-52]